MAQSSKQDHSTIPKLDLEDFQFSPPGSMGWSFAEYEKIVNSDEQVLTVDTTSTLSSPPVPNQTLRELPQGSAYPVHLQPLDEKETSVVPSTEEPVEVIFVEPDDIISEQPEEVENELLVAGEPEQSRIIQDYALAVRRITTPHKLTDKKSKPHRHFTHFEVRKEKVKDEQSDPVEEVIEEDIFEAELELSEIDIDDVEEEVEIEKEEAEIEEVKEENDSLIEGFEVDKKEPGVFFVKTMGSGTQPWLSF
ncbi:hypothetical protein [Guptibacillus hwajinpoensis]|uniref:Uncharacterized protein n=1 Tax=Guptibacillus hwajinpoensis TaxID=208199 RepID=A0A0J6CRE3_9BACL|nr:hypothetical protein [Alkalihalobacillus macyae]KMM38876.1 hypothetical protein AB986_06355 [Alkalihalobacillus macyae]